MRWIVLGFALALLPFCASAWAQAHQADARTAAAPVVEQLEAFRRDDFDAAFTYASAEIQARFDRRAFETMVRSGYPEIARSSFAAIVKTELGPDGAAYVTVKVHGANGRSVEALYELVWQDGWKINGVATKPDGGVT